MRLETLVTLVLGLLLPIELPVDIQARAEFVVWNVGQGLWTSWIFDDQCWHFDMGGEYKTILTKIAQNCRQRQNRVFLSHWDMDHIGFVKSARRHFISICLAVEPGGQPSPSKLAMISGFSPCPSQSFVQTLWSATAGDPQLRKGQKNRSNNHDSHVFLLAQKRILVPGDSTKDEEKIWSHRLGKTVEGLVLGHHGSHSSTSDELIAHLPKLRWSVASQRQKRYGHPHRQVIELLRKAKIPLLRTEDWGSIHFQL